MLHRLFFACSIPKKNSPGLRHNLKLQRFTSSVVALRVVWEVRVISFSKIIIEFLVRWFENHYGFETLWWNHCGFKKNHSGFEKHHGFKNDKSFYCTVIAYSFEMHLKVCSFLFTTHFFHPMTWRLTSSFIPHPSHHHFVNSVSTMVHSQPHQDHSFQSDSSTARHCEADLDFDQDVTPSSTTLKSRHSDG